MKSSKGFLIIIISICFLSNIFIVSGLKSEPLGEFDTPPTIDGIFSNGEWKISQIFIENNTMMNDLLTVETYAYFVNDQENLYVMVDATGDPTDDAGDECLLRFHNEGVTRDIEIIGASGAEKNTNFIAKVGYGQSPNNPNDHKIYEFCIPLAYLNTGVVDFIDFCSPAVGKKIASMPYDSSTGRDNEWPPELDVENMNTWDEVEISEKPSPVGGELVTKTTMMLPLAILFIAFTLLKTSKNKNLEFLS